jgi:hypothetical protein
LAVRKPSPSRLFLPTARALGLGLTLAGLLVGCGGDARLTRAEADAIRDRARQATDGDKEMGGSGNAPLIARHEDSPARADIDPDDAELPAAPPGHLVGDGFGPSQREAVLDARRAVSEQITAQMKSQSDVQTAEYNGEVDQSARVKVSTTSAFDHVELISTLGTQRLGDQKFAARAVLPLDRALGVYAEEIRQGYERLVQIEPVVRRGIAEADTSILLRADHAPGALMAEQRRRARIIRALGGTPPELAPEGTSGLEQEAGVARSKSLIRLSIQSDSPDPLRRAVAAEVSTLLAAGGCHMAEMPLSAPEPGIPVADATLVVHHRDHQERGLRWRYVGFELKINDARTRRPVFQYAALPEIAHGGGKGLAQADQAAVRNLALKLAERVPRGFEGLVCR